MNAEKLLSPTPLESSSMTQAKQLLESWKDREYRADFVRERVRSSVALQIRALREQRNGMTQKQLGDALGKAQTWISVLEDPEYGKMSVATLLSLAEAFDTDLEIKFRPFSRALHELTKQGSEYFEVRSFDQELPDLESAATLEWIVPHGKWSDILRAAVLLSQESPKESLNATASASGAMQSEIIQIPGSCAPIIFPTTGFKLLEDEPQSRNESYGLRRPRRQNRLARRKETIWRKRKLPKLQASRSNFSGAEKTTNPYTQIMFTFSQASGT